MRSGEPVNLGFRDSSLGFLGFKIDSSIFIMCLLAFFQFCDIQISFPCSIIICILFKLVKSTTRLAGKALLKMIKRWPLMISKCVLSLTDNLRNPNSPEHAVLGSCAVLSSQTVLKHLTMVFVLDGVLTKVLPIRNKAFPSFV